MSGEKAKWKTQRGVETANGESCLMGKLSHLRTRKPSRGYEHGVIAGCFIN